MNKMLELAENSLIFVQDNFFSDALCDQIISAFESDESNKHPGYTLGGLDDTKVSTDINLTPDMKFWNETWKSLDAEICDRINVMWIEFSQDFMVFANAEIVDSSYQIQKYEPRVGKYGWHIDGGLGHAPARQVALIVYLNDVLLGGETEFSYQKVKVEAKKGRLAVFPAFWTHEHRGRMPISGPKFILTTFMQMPEMVEMGPPRYEEDYGHYNPEVVVSPFTPEDPSEVFSPFAELGGMPGGL